MTLNLYSSLSKKIEPFIPLKKGEVSLYICGITPDAASHLGHAFTYISFDALIHYLKFLGNKVNYVQNITDIDDDILVRSKAAGRDWREFGDHWANVFAENMHKLNWIGPDPYVKATEAVPTIIKIVADLVEGGLAYNVAGTVYFDVAKFKSYGQLSGFNEKQMIMLSRERGADPDDPNKRNPLDFIMWQIAKEGEPSWSSPFGEGRPGWHIECSSMIYDNLGEQIDIHGGGRDLIFPHHESEIAQSESFTGKSPFVKYWMHTGTVFYMGEKMAKSLGNLILVSDLLKKYSANEIRYCLLSHHYRALWEFEILEMEDCVVEFRTLLENCSSDNSDTKDLDPDFLNALNNDFDTPRALKLLLEKKPKSLASCLRVLGFQV